MTHNTFQLNEPRLEDGPRLWQLVKDCPPLDLNSPYLYLLLCRDHAATCVLARDGDRLAGAVTAYIPPGRPDTLFVWQIAVHETARGNGLGRRLLADLLGRPACREIRWLETTITPDNSASQKLFAAFAREKGVDIREKALFDQHHFPPGQGHAPERLYRLGPFAGASLSTSKGET